MLAIAERLEGLYSNASTHAAGVVIGDRPLIELAPLYRDPKSAMPATQFNMKWVEQAGLVKFDFLGLKTLTVLKRAVDLIARRGEAIDLEQDPARRCQDLRDARARRDGRRVPGGKRRHAQGAGRHARRPVRGPHRAGRALSPGPDGEHSDLLRPQARTGEARLHPCPDRAGPKRDLRRHHLSGTGDADRAGAVGLFARRSRHAAPRDGQEDQEGDGRAARPLRRRRGRARPHARQGGRDLRSPRQIRRLRLQQEPRRGLCADRLLDRLVQGQPSGRIPRRLDDARQGQHRQARRIPHRGAAPRHQGRRAVGQ